MTKSQAFQYADPLVVAQMFASNATVTTLTPLKTFIKRKNKLPLPVISMMVLYIIAADSENKPKGILPNRESYYRIVQEEWINMNLLTSEAVLSYFAEALEHVAKDEKNLVSVKPRNIFPKAEIDPSLDAALDNIYHNIK